ncbi:MAG: sugar transferase [Prochlorotrichaceae cyanobacterium]
MSSLYPATASLPVPFQNLLDKKADIRAPGPWNLVDLLTWRWYRALILLGADTIALGGAWQLARHFNQFYSPIPDALVWWVWFDLPSLFWLATLMTLIVFAHNGLYSQVHRSHDYLRAGRLVSGVYLFSLVVSYFYDPMLNPPRSLFLTAWSASVVFVIVLRLLALTVLGSLERRYFKTSIFVIAPAAEIKSLSEVLIRRCHHYHLVGAALASVASTEHTFRTILESHARIVLVRDLPDINLASGLYWRLKRAGIVLHLLPSSREMLYRRGIPEVIAGIPTLRMDAPLIDGIDYRIKRVIDYLGTIVGLILLAPFFVLLAIVIYLDCPGPVFFRQERIGLHGRIFQVWKFRTMAVNAPQLQDTLEQHNEAADKVLFKIKADPRVTRIGKLLRRTSLDELPQLFNVLCGEMSLVGPRPLPLRDVAQFEQWHHIRHKALPGITGLWQVSGRSDLDSFDDAARLDLYYIDNWSLNLDLEILMETIKIVLLGKGAY